jgi:hypothetical protein
MRGLLKLKIDGDDVLVKYVEREGGEDDGDTVTLESSDPPLPELREALQAMAEHMVAICELPAKWTEEIRIVGVTVTYSDDVRGLVITGLRRLQGHAAPLVLNSPHATNEEKEQGPYTVACGPALDELEEEVWRYVDGERAQLQLSLEPVGAVAN